MEDQGFFKINRALSGDFVVIARFRGTDGGAELGPEGVLFRYANHTCFLPEGDQVSLRKSEVRVGDEVVWFCLFLGPCVNVVRFVVFAFLGYVSRKATK